MEYRNGLLARVPAYILFVAIAGAPLPFGSRDLTTIAAWCFVLGLGLILAPTRELRRGHLVLLGGLAFLAACYGFVLHEQLSDRPWVAEADPIWAKAAELLGHPLQSSASIVRGEPFYALGPSLAAALALALGLLVGTDSVRARQALEIMGWSGVGYAAYGFAKLGSGGLLNATFVNRNTAAAYFGSCSIIWLALLMMAIRQRIPAGPIVWTNLVRQLAPDPSEEDRPEKKDTAARYWAEAKPIVRFCAFFGCVTAMFLTTSRAGSIASLFAMVVTFLLFFRRDMSRGLSLALATGTALAAAWLLLHVMGGEVEGRFDTSGLVDQGRAAAYRSTVRIIADHPWFGTGLGTFAQAFPPYRSEDITILRTWDSAHSTPLQLAAELGIPLTLVIVLAWAIAFVVLFRGTRRSRRETVAPLAALGVALVANIHSAVDFSLQVPGYAIVIFAIVGVGLAQSLQDSPSPRPQRRRRRADASRD